MSKQTEGKQPNKVGAFLKKNIYYILMVVAVLAIISMVVVAAVMSSNANKPTPNGPVITEPDKDQPTIDDKPSIDDKPIIKPETPVFVMMSPVSGASLGLGYSADELVFHPTQGAWKTHLGIDYIAPKGTSVMAVESGKIKSIETDGYYGTTMTIEHQDGFVSCYRLLDKEVAKKVGDVVKKGDVIGTVGNNSTYEVKQGDHIHFELMKNGDIVDPNLYFAEGDK